MSLRRFAGAVAIVVLAFASAATAAPAAGRVRLLQSSAMSPRARRCLTRLREELTAGGFEVTIEEFGAGGEAPWMVDPPTAQGGSLATITLVGNPDEEAAELWVVDGIAGGHAAVRRLLVPAGAGTHDDEVLAIRTLEFLRASALELARAAPARPANTVPPTSAQETVTVAAPPVAPASRRRLSVELGLGVLESSSSLGPAYLPLVRLRANLLSLLEARVTLAGLGTRPGVTAPEGTATVGNSFGLVELRAAFRQAHTVRPAVGVGVGALLAQVDGKANAPYGDLNGHTWAALFDVGAGVTIALGHRFGLSVEAHGQIAAPYPTVQFFNDEAARIARPALLTSLTLVTAL
ncbi:MAG: hypothetical protein ABUS79_18200 [Pseudomonadota bacterium]